jgi:hypothetical protein
MPKTLFSQAELNLLMSLTLTVTFIFFLNLENKITDDYNQGVKSEQLDKLRLANNPDSSKVSFGLTNCYGPPFWFLLYGLQFFTNPLSFFLVRTQTLGRFILSSIFTTVTVYCFSMWIYETFYYARLDDYDLSKDISFNEFFLYGSNKLEFILFLSVLILFIIQFFILLRFVIEKFQAKISLR